MWKRKVGIISAMVFGVISFCTISSIQYEEKSTENVEIVMPKRVEGPIFAIPEEAIVKETYIWIIENKETIWGIEARAVLTQINVIENKNGTVKFSGIYSGENARIAIGELEGLTEYCKVRVVNADKYNCND